MADRGKSSSTSSGQATGLAAADEADMFRSLAVNSPDGMIVADSDGIIIWANHVAQEMFGREPGSLVGTPVVVLVPEDLSEQAFLLRREVLAGKRIEAFVTTGIRADGARFPFSVTPAIRRADDGRVLGINAIVRDLTDQMRTQEELTEALARFHARFDQVAEPRALLDLEGRVVAINDAGCRLLDRRRSDLVGHHALALIEPVDAASVERLKDLGAGTVDAITIDAIGHRSDGGQVPLLLDISLVSDRDGHPRELAVFARDLTEVREAQARLEAKDAFFRGVYSRAADPAMVIDAEARIRYVSPSFTRVLGYSAVDVIGRLGLELAHPEDREASRRMIADLLHRPGASDRLLLRAHGLHDDWRWFDAVATNAIDDPTIGGIVVNLRDVTRETEARDELRRSEARYRAIAETAQEGIMAVTLTGQILFANEKAAEILGVPLEHLYRAGLLGLFDESQADRVRSRLRSRHDAGAETFEVPYRHPAIGRRILSVAASPLSGDDGEPLGTLGMISDVTLERQAEAELRHQALHDALTGLPNRALLIDRLTMAGARQQRDHGHGLAVLFLDLDHFKLVNDSWGHDAGDRLLVEVAARLEDAVRETDTVARLGGDEFAVVCEEVDEDAAAVLADRIQEALDEPFTVSGELLHVSASIGVALSPPHRVSDLLRFADSAMYQSKVSGRRRVTSFDEGHADLAERRLSIARGLRDALAEESLTLGYQPIVDLRTEQVLGVEALLRWKHPTLGAVPPEELLIAAETAGLSFELDRCVIRTAGRDLLFLRGRGLVAADVYLSVNVSPRTTAQQRLDSIVHETLAATGLPPSCLTLEITEHAIMDNADHAVALLTRLTRSGVRVAIDDFGTGYNSLVHLQRLPASTLKIDRSFVAGIHEGESSRVIARSIVGLAQALGKFTVAEGVETVGQLEALSEIGCDAAQGFLWSPAVLVEELPAVVARLSG